MWSIIILITLLLRLLTGKKEISGTERDICTEIRRNVLRKFYAEVLKKAFGRQSLKKSDYFGEDLKEIYKDVVPYE